MSIMEIFKNRIDTFNDRVMPNVKLSRGILNSEGFAFCAMVDHLGAKLIMESGVCNGGSTTIIGKYFTGIPIVSVDLKTKVEASIRTSIFHNVTLVSGDSNVLLPQAIDVFADKKIAVLIDGPKGEKAIKLALDSINISNVVMVGIHDLFRSLHGEPKRDRVIFDNLSLDKFATDDIEFVNLFGHLDTENDGTPFVRHEKYCHKSQGYGPTLGLLIKENVE
ncbi:hypothetical protein KAR91_20680 [Candidatus Pacearchaeota archaeon]|nr:hypothetical protein [Candidatus Pacearchaeota archaeon]